MTRQLVVVSAGPVQLLPPDPPSLVARILAFLGFGGQMAAQPPANVTAQFDKPAYNPGDLMTILVTAESVNGTAVPFTVPITVVDTSVTPPQQATVQATASISAPNLLAASEGDTSGRAWQQGKASQDASGAFSTSFSAVA